ncbi:RmlC-like cupin domain-containing protein [Lasiosphaeria hispida]|uniref:RmlC-like cupin domain-containing protein n=1 Tax=Lasiosphaeria hispida TaxID=260671 RepID=A0AAJ0HRN3_9PEZI|nr:RmlC-like cupin domain-containing protein [Lasiosphaeria hispida]
MTNGMTRADLLGAPRFLSSKDFYVLTQVYILFSNPVQLCGFAQLDCSPSSYHILKHLHHFLHLKMATSSEPTPSFPSSSDPSAPEPAAIQSLITHLDLQPLIEGGYFVETDRDPLLIPSPFPPTPATPSHPSRPGFDPALRNASTNIFYLLTPRSPLGHLHRNRPRIIHTLHRGRGRYVVIHAEATPPRVETFVVGPNVEAGERLQWIIEGGTYKASFLLPDREGGSESKSGLLITETVVPGFELFDHDFLTKARLERLVGTEEARKLAWLVKPEEE